jgi:Tfp pilus assembly protein PilV
MPGRVSEEAGMGLVELLIAMTVMSIGIFALVAGLSSGHVTLQRASTNSTAAALADEQMEAFRAARWDAVGLDPAAATPTDSTYTSDPANAAAQIKVKKAETTTIADIDDAATTLSVAAATGFPVVYPFDVVIQTAKDDQSAREIVSVTAATGTTWTVTRAQSGTTATNHPAGSYVASVNYVTNLGCGSADYCQPMRTDGRYRIDTYVSWTCPIGTIGGSVDAPTCTPSGTTKDRPAKLVTIVVRDAADTAKILVREASTFDESSG